MYNFISQTSEYTSRALNQLKIHINGSTQLYYRYKY